MTYTIHNEVAGITDKQAEAALLAVELEDTIAGFVRGLRKPRLNPVTRKQIEKHVARFPMFSGTDVDGAIDCLLSEGRIRIVAMSLGAHRRHNGAYGYCVD